jgi:hypothetical protein
MWQSLAHEKGSKAPDSGVRRKKSVPVADVVRQVTVRQVCKGSTVFRAETRGGARYHVQAWFAVPGVDAVSTLNVPSDLGETTAT